MRINQQTIISLIIIRMFKTCVHSVSNRNPDHKLFQMKVSIVVEGKMCPKSCPSLKIHLKMLKFVLRTWPLPWRSGLFGCF